MATDVLTVAINKNKEGFYNKLLYLVFKQINVITPATHMPTEQTVVPIKKLLLSVSFLFSFSYS